VLQQNKPYYYVVPFACNGGDIGTNCSDITPYSGHEIYQRMARGNSTTFMEERGNDNPLQGLCQGNGVSPACWLMISLLLINCYQFQGYRSRLISPISGTIIDFLGKIYINNMDLIVTRPKLTMAAAVHKELNRSASAWAAGLNAIGGALNLDKCKWTLADYCWHNGRWGYAKQPELDIEIPLLNGTTAKISQERYWWQKKLLESGLVLMAKRTYMSNTM
jgi:hypothetical protein